MLRIIFSRLGQPRIGPSTAFSFNLPDGMCPRCEGLGQVSTIDVDQLVDRELSLNEGAITVPQFHVDSWYWQVMALSGFYDPDKKLKDFTDQEWDDFLHRPSTKVRVGSNNLGYEGLVVKVNRIYLTKDRESMQGAIKAFVDRAVVFAPCPSARAPG